jgi:hypothetical protein
VEISDERAGVTGRVLALDLTLMGVRLSDTDHDGLDDDWERTHFGNLTRRPRRITTATDGATWEQILGMNPRVSERPFALQVCAWDARFCG